MSDEVIQEKISIWIVFICIQDSSANVLEKNQHEADENQSENNTTFAESEYLKMQKYKIPS